MLCPPTRAALLFFGHDATLLMTRQRMLEREGCTVLLATSQAEFHSIILSRSLDLVLLCQTLSELERRSAVRFLAEYAPAVHCAVLHLELGVCGIDLAMPEIDVGKGPASFVHAITGMLPPGHREAMHLG